MAALNTCALQCTYMRIIKLNQMIAMDHCALVQLYSCAGMATSMGLLLCDTILLSTVVSGVSGALRHCLLQSLRPNIDRKLRGGGASAVDALEMGPNCTSW